MTNRYYAHFVADSTEPQVDGEYSGVVEVAAPLHRNRETRELRTLLANNFELDAEDIRILNWAVLH